MAHTPSPRVANTPTAVLANEVEHSEARPERVGLADQAVGAHRLALRGMGIKADLVEALLVEPKADGNRQVGWAPVSEDVPLSVGVEVVVPRLRPAKW